MGYYFHAFPRTYESRYGFASQLFHPQSCVLLSTAHHTLHLFRWTTGLRARIPRVSCDISSRKNLEEEEEVVEMGSLMAGWSSPVVDPEKGRITSFTSVLLLRLLMCYAATRTALLKRNKSLTKEEIDSFWRLHRPTKEEEEDFHASLSSPRTPQVAFLSFHAVSSSFVSLLLSFVCVCRSRTG